MSKLLGGMVIVFFSAFLSEAQEPPAAEQPTEQHAWLMKFAGEWETVSQVKSGPGQPDIECTGTMNSRSVGGFWIVNDLKTSFSGQPFSGVQTIGYDPKSKKYIGTWVDSMSSYIWKYEGKVSDDGTTLTLNAKGPNMLVPDAEANYRDIYVFKSNDEIVIRSEVETPDGEWVTFMTGTSKRKK